MFVNLDFRYHIMFKEIGGFSHIFGGIKSNATQIDLLKKNLSGITNNNADAQNNNNNNHRQATVPIGRQHLVVQGSHLSCATGDPATSLQCRSDL